MFGHQAVMIFDSDVRASPGIPRIVQQQSELYPAKP